MKIDDLIRPKNVVHKFTHPDDFWLSRLTKYRKKHDTKDKEGSFSYVADNQRDPHVIDKKSKMKLGSPGFDKYVSYVIENQNKNPFLPRIYKIDKRVNSDGDVVTDYQIEKLKQADEFDPLVMTTYLKRLFDFDDFPKDFDNPDPDFTDVIKMMGYIWNILFNNYYNLVRSKLLLKTLQDIQQLISPMQIDTSYKNLLFRTGPHGPQLVLSDPIGFLSDEHKKEYIKYISNNKKYI